MVGLLGLVGQVAHVVAASFVCQPVSFRVDETIVEVGRTRVIAFEGEAPGVDETPSFEVTPAGPDVAAEVVRAPERLAGERIGFVRVRGLAPGEAALRVGDGRIRLRVVPARSDLGAGSERPRVVGPGDGACVWGTISIGVEFDSGWWRPGMPEPAAGLRVGRERVLEASSLTPARNGPMRLATFELDADRLGEGVATLVPTATVSDGSVIEGEPVRVRVVRVSPGGEAEPGRVAIQTYEAERPGKCDVPRRFGGGAEVTPPKPSLNRDAEASGGAYVSNAGAVPPVCVPIEVERAGMYQMIVRASGDAAVGGTLPTIGFVVDGADYPATNGRLVSGRWHRAAIGVPVRLEAGAHVVTPYFENDYYVPRLADRNLRLDTIELARVGDAAEGVAAGAGGGMMSMMSGGGGTTGAADEFDERSASLRVAWNAPLHGLVVGGRLAIEGTCWWEGWPRPSPGRVPSVTLLVNGEGVGTQRTGAPRFWLDVGRLKPGENRIEMVARSEGGGGGAVARAPAQTIVRAEAIEPAPARRFERFSVHDERWEGPEARAAHYPGEGVCFVFASEGEAVLALPEDLTGTFRVLLECMGEVFEGEPIARVTLDAGGTTHDVGEVRAGGWWDTRPAGACALEPGPKSLRVRFTNDRFEAGKGDRNLYVQGLVLSEAWDEADRTPPSCEVVHPPEGARVGAGDVIVVEASDDRGPTWCALVVDGVETGAGRPIGQRGARFLLPVSTRGLDPGEHTLAVRVTDEAGNLSVSVARRIIVGDEADGGFEHAVRVLDRFGYGPGERELIDVLTMGEAAWLEDRLSRGADDPGDLAALGYALVRFPNRQSEYDIPRRAILHATLTPNPVRARFVLWAQDHFSTWIRKTEADKKWREHVAFARLGVGTFPDLLMASATSPAMLRYLDQEQSYSGRLNENYAREVMELHTLGVDGGYSQADVTSLAHVLTGWTVARQGDGRSGGYVRDDAFRFDPGLGDSSDQRVFGLRLPAGERETRHDRPRLALEMLAAHPRTARFVCRSMAEHYLGIGVSEEVVEALALEFERTYGDLGSVMRVLASRAEVRSSPARVTHPLDYALRLSRVSGHVNPWEVGDYLQRSGTGLFDRATPDGYPEEDAAYLDSNAMIQRWRLARTMLWSIASLCPDPWRWGEERADRWAQDVIDAIAIRMTGHPLGPDSNQAALDFASGLEGNNGARVLEIGVFIAQLPEANLR